MKKILIFLMLIMASGLVYAEAFEVYSFKVYGDDEQIPADWDDDTFDAYLGQTIELQIRFENNWNETADVKVESTLFDIGGDLDRQQNIDVSPDDRETVVFEYYIPSNEKEGIYDLEVKYTYEFNNGTEYTEEKTFEIDLRKKEIPLEDMFLNVTRLLAGEKEKTNNLLSAVINISGVNSELSSCKSELGSLRANNNISSDYKGKYEDLNTKYITLTEDNTECQSEKRNMYSQTQLDTRVENAKVEAKREQKSKDDNILMIAGGAAAIYFFWNKKKKEIGSKDKTKSLTVNKWG